MRNIFFTLFLSLIFFSSCKEWEPLFSYPYYEPEITLPPPPEVNTTIAQLKALYTTPGKPVKIEQDLVIKGQVISSDEAGNIYRSLYIQDETGAIEIKIGKTSLYSDYKLGQWIYVKCDGLSLGAYEGMLQLGLESDSDKYETSYIDVQILIDQKIIKGEIGKAVKPVIVTEAELNAAVSDNKHPLLGRYISLKGLTYGAKSSYSTDKFKRIFCLIYIDPNKDPKDNANRIFLSKETYGVDTWAMSKNNFISRLEKGDFNSAAVADGSPISEEVKAKLKKYASAVTVSQYFSIGDLPVQIRTSGYSKFADSKIPSSVIGNINSIAADGKSIDATGILTVYKGSAQFTLIDLNGVKVNN